MSAAEPMDAATRGEHYAAHPDQFTPRQARRVNQKDGHAFHGLGAYEPVDPEIPEGQRPKGTPTTRQKDAISQGRARRRAKERIRVARR
jgi:hypothetical protein